MLCSGPKLIKAPLPMEVAWKEFESLNCAIVVSVEILNVVLIDLLCRQKIILQVSEFEALEKSYLEVRKFE